MVYIKVYGCVECQQRHYEDNPLYEAHIGWQSKHGVTTQQFEDMEAYYVFKRRHVLKVSDTTRPE